MTTEQSIRLVVPRVQFAPQLEFKNWIFCLNLFSVYSIIFCNYSLLRAFDEEQQKVFPFKSLLWKVKKLGTNRHRFFLSTILSKDYFSELQDELNSAKG